MIITGEETTYSMDNDKGENERKKHRTGKNKN